MLLSLYYRDSLILMDTVENKIIEVKKLKSSWNLLLISEMM